MKEMSRLSLNHKTLMRNSLTCGALPFGLMMFNVIRTPGYNSRSVDAIKSVSVQKRHVELLYILGDVP